MRKKTSIITFIFGIIFACLSFCNISICLAKQLPSAFDPTRHLPLSKVKPGMKGYGLSIFKGTKIEKFDVTVLDVIHNFNPKLDVILVELSGHRLKETGVIAGMSGSPVYFKDPDDGKFKLAGAVAYGWALSRPGFATGGVQPIEQMLQVATNKPKQSATSSPADRNLFCKTLAALTNDSNLKEFDRFILTQAIKTDNTDNTNADNTYENSNNEHPILPEGLRPLSTPICASGLSLKTLKQLQPIFNQENLSLVLSGSAGAGDIQQDNTTQNDIVPAGVLAVPLLIGDLNLAGIGTVTERIGNRFWGFGHPMFAEGPSELPMGAGRIHSIIATLVNSFKLGSAYKPIGTLYHDQATAVAGKIGIVPKMAPITINVNFAGQKISYHYQLAMHKKLSPILLMICANESILARKDLPELNTVKYSGELKFEEFDPINLNNVISNVSIKPLLADIAEPVFIMLNNDFKTIKLESVKLNVDVKPISKYAEILQAALDKNSYKPGEQANIILRLMRIKKPDYMTKISFTIPEDLPDGKYPLSISGMNEMLLTDRMANPYIYKPQNIKEMYQMIKHITKFRSDRFYITIRTRHIGLGAHGCAMPDLPISKLEQLAKAEPAITTKISKYKIIEIPTQHIIYGSFKLRLNISRTQ